MSWVGPDGRTYQSESQGRAYMANFGGGSRSSGGPPPPPMPPTPSGGGTPNYTSTTERSPEADWLMDKYKSRFDTSVKAQTQEQAADAIRSAGAGMMKERQGSLAARGLEGTGAGEKSLDKLAAQTAGDVDKAMTDIEIGDQSRQDALTMGGTAIAGLGPGLQLQGQALNNQSAQIAAQQQQQAWQAQLAYLQAMYGGTGGGTGAPGAYGGGYTGGYQPGPTPAHSPIGTAGGSSSYRRPGSSPI